MKDKKPEPVARDARPESPGEVQRETQTTREGGTHFNPPDAVPVNQENADA